MPTSVLARKAAYVARAGADVLALAAVQPARQSSSSSSTHRRDVVGMLSGHARVQRQWRLPPLSAVYVSTL